MEKNSDPNLVLHFQIEKLSFKVVVNQISLSFFKLKKKIIFQILWMKSTEILMLNMWRWNRINYFCFIIDERTGLYFNDFGTFLSHLIEVEMQLHFRHQERRRGWKVLLKLSTLRSDWEKPFALPHHPSNTEKYVRIVPAVTLSAFTHTFKYFIACAFWMDSNTIWNTFEHLHLIFRMAMHNLRGNTH